MATRLNLWPSSASLSVDSTISSKWSPRSSICSSFQEDGVYYMYVFKNVSYGVYNMYIYVYVYVQGHP